MIPNPPRPLQKTEYNILSILDSEPKLNFTRKQYYYTHLSHNRLAGSKSQEIKLS
jgi:hypothetical protein